MIIIKQIVFLSMPLIKLKTKQITKNDVSDVYWKKQMLLLIFPSTQGSRNDSRVSEILLFQTQFSDQFRGSDKMYFDNQANLGI